MNVINLIRQHPMLSADLQSLGLPHTRLVALADNISAQLGGGYQQNLYQVLSALTSTDFVRRVNVSTLASDSDISPVLAQSAILMIAPWVGQFHSATTH